MAPPPPQVSRRTLFILAAVWSAVTSWLVVSTARARLSPNGAPLPPILHATIDRPDWRQRLIIVGDVHGCLDELLRLLAAAEYARETDQLVFLGDLVDKGPRVPALLRFLRREGALAVRGNHDDAMLGFVHRLGGRAEGAAAAAGGEEEGVDAGERDAASSSAGAPPAQLPIAEWAADPQSAVASLPAEYAYLRYLGARDIRYLHERPYSLRAPEQGLVMVHAGLFPGRPLRSQALADLLNVRTVRPANPASGAPARASAENDEPGALPWAALYGGEEGHVVFGHDARLGLQRWPFATGLDSGCVYGGNLSTLIVPDGARLGRRRWPFAAGLEGGCATGGNASARVAADGGAARAARTTPGAGPDSAPAPGPAAAAPSRAGEAGAEAEQPCILSVRAARAYY